MKEAIFTKSISINLAKDTFEKIKEVTDLKRISISEWFRLAASQALNTQQEDTNNDTHQG
ncbi:MAG: hypothetical protein HOG03_24155 [Desulfobacula sp.]|jgi:hypothetical protein|uniref:hypothetical protein n=1 Tax=Desulfobacula sp. TaxID=2593537 RepID=UPI001DC9002C|nr:hypothetical protein [Desulfobacula sp.]MBT3807654.1 hypothetical protein [Desulfobacula sp.]MBT7262064.1 hypothetical protein [Desulfobacula sp.]